MHVSKKCLYRRSFACALPDWQLQPEDCALGSLKDTGQLLLPHPPLQAQNLNECI